MKQIFKAILILVALLSVMETKATCTNYLTIDSLPQLEGYDFIALVKIVDAPDNLFSPTALLTIKIIELFKGDSIVQILEYDRNTSSAIGVSKDEEWILFGINNSDGQTTIQGCDRHQRYREANEVRDWQYYRGFRELSKLRELYLHIEKEYVNGIHQEFYANGQQEIEETYVNGMRQGERKIWYPNGALYCNEYYVNDTLDRKAEWFYPTGQISDEGYYVKGKSFNVSRHYFDSIQTRNYINAHIRFHKINNTDSLSFALNRIQPQYERVVDSYGRLIIAREYTRFGTIHREEIFDPERKTSTLIYYHDNGLLSSISYSHYLTDQKYGHYQSYDKKGVPNQSWDYDENGEKIQK